jgi:hypothetical protein
LSDDARKYGVSESRHEIAQARATLNKAGVDAAKVVSDLAAPHVAKAMANLVRISDDLDNRQSRQASVDILNFYLSGSSTGNTGGESGNTRVLIVNAPDMHRLSEMERLDRLEAKAKRAPPCRSTGA